jgi:site-specific recombinase XerD
VKARFTATGKVGVFYYESTERSDKCYYITYKVGKVKKREKIGWKSDGYNTQIASSIRSDRLQQLKHGNDILRRITFKQGMDMYKESIKELIYFPDVLRHLNSAAAFFGYSTLLSSITPIDIVDYITNLKSRVSKKGKPLAASTVSQYFKGVQQMYNYLIGVGVYSGQNPCNKKARLTLPKINNQITNYLSDEEAQTVINVLTSYKDRFLANFFLFSFYTGVRRGAVFNLTKKNIDIERGILYLPAKIAKSKKDETLELSDKAIEVVKNQIKLLETNNITAEQLFCQSNGKKRKDVKVQFATLKRKAGITRYFRFHDVRHNFATALIDSGADLYTVQALLNHKDPKTTQRYAHIKTGRLREAANKAFSKV